jgi:photosystem II PsbY protein
VPAATQVAFNIGQPALNQLDSMSAKKSVAAGLGLGAASLLMAGKADAATEAMQLAGSDSRVGILLTLFVPVIGWVLFNILGPAQNQVRGRGPPRPGAGAGLLLWPAARSELHGLALTRSARPRAACSLRICRTRRRASRLGSAWAPPAC